MWTTTLSPRLDHMEGENVSTAQHKRLELKIRELESKLELEKTTKQRQETQISRQKEVNVVECLDLVGGLGQGMTNSTFCLRVG